MTCPDPRDDREAFDDARSTPASQTLLAGGLLWRRVNSTRW